MNFSLDQIAIAFWMALVIYFVFNFFLTKKKYALGSSCHLSFQGKFDQACESELVENNYDAFTEFMDGFADRKQKLLWHKYARYRALGFIPMVIELIFGFTKLFQALSELLFWAGKDHIPPYLYGPLEMTGFDSGMAGFFSSIIWAAIFGASLYILTFYLHELENFLLVDFCEKAQSFYIKKYSKAEQRAEYAAKLIDSSQVSVDQFIQQLNNLTKS